MGNADVVVVGGGVGGASLASALAREGLGVTVLEATVKYPDRVRGESMHAWGLLEARNLGVESVLLDAGAHIAPLWKQYIEGIGEAGEIPVGMMLPGIAGTLNMRHPVVCQALVEAAAAAGATVVRGVEHVTLRHGAPPAVSYTAQGRTDEVSASLVVGADGRTSTVRRQTGIPLEHQAPINYVAGLLVDGLDDVPNDYDVLVGEGDAMFVLFHQGAGRATSTSCQGCPDGTGSPGPTARSVSPKRAGCRPIRTASRWRRPRRSDRSRPIRATTAGPMPRTSTVWFSLETLQGTTTQSSARDCRSPCATRGSFAISCSMVPGRRQRSCPTAQSGRPAWNGCASLPILSR